MLFLIHRRIFYDVASLVRLGIIGIVAVICWPTLGQLAVCFVRAYWWSCDQLLNGQCSTLQLPLLLLLSSYGSTLFVGWARTGTVHQEETDLAAAL